jgi:hypothetical protein
MSINRNALAALALGILSTLPAAGAQVDFGPFPDFRGISELVGGCQVIPTRTDVDSLNIHIRDRIELCFGATKVPLIDLTYIHLTNLSLNGVKIVDVWGIDLNPNGSAFAETGFNPSTPEAVPNSNEDFFGISGTDYPANFSATTSLAGLPTVMSSLGLSTDLSPFSGNPNSILYVFSADLPLSDATTPEPGSFSTTIIGFGLVSVFWALARYRKRPPQIEGAVSNPSSSHAASRLTPGETVVYTHHRG